jgi:methionine-R-sulfoxide reductase
MIIRHLLPAALLLSMVSCMCAETNMAASKPSNLMTNAGSGHSACGFAVVSVRLIGPDGQPGPVVQSPRVVKTDSAWEKQLGPTAYRVLRAKGTEAPFCGNLLDNHKTGIYFCAGCDLPLFSSGSKFHSGTGWPSFYQPFAKENITELRDASHGMIRTEILCARCGGHLGHVFEDGPPPTGLRYCLNSVSLTFRDESEVKAMEPQAKR